MVPGYLHFDLRRGCSADMLAAAMSQLLPSQEVLRQAFDALGFNEIAWEFISDASRGVKGRIVHFYVNNNLVSLAPGALRVPNRSASKTAPVWDLDPTAVPPENSSHKYAKNELLQACLLGEAVGLEQLRKPFFRPQVSVEIAGICLEILSNLECDIFVEQKLSGYDALWLLCHLVMLVAELSALDPKFVSASKICLSSGQTAASLYNTQSLNDETWLRHILSRVPMIEVCEPLRADVLAVAFIKTLAGQFGPRGDSTILTIGLGLSSATNAWTEALWCEASLPDTMNEIGPANRPRSNYLFEVGGQVSSLTDMASVAAMMSLHGAKSFSYHLVHCEKQTNANLVRFLVSHDRQREALEAFLIKGNAQHLTVKPVEYHELNKRIVSVPLGSGNKTSSYRLYEYIYYERCVRVEPLAEDLDLYVQKTDYSVDVARSDLLMAWKKWRGQTIAE